MPTLEEELRALRGELSVMQSQHLSDVQQLTERINMLQQQLDEQQKRVSGQGQSIHQRFDNLEKALIQQFNVVSQQFGKLEQRMDQQTVDLKQKFDSVDHFAGRTWGLVYEREQDIREMKADIGVIKEQVAEVRQDINSRFDAQGQILSQILERLPKQ